MTRWRPPQTASTAIITEEGHIKLKTELDHLWRAVRPDVVKALSAAAAEGDRSENAEYIYRKNQLRDCKLSKSRPKNRPTPRAYFSAHGSKPKTTTARQESIVLWDPTKPMRQKAGSASILRSPARR